MINNLLRRYARQQPASGAELAHLNVTERTRSGMSADEGRARGAPGGVFRPRVRGNLGQRLNVSYLLLDRSFDRTGKSQPCTFPRRVLRHFDREHATMKYRLPHEHGATKYAVGRDTTPAYRSPKVQKGCGVDIKHLDGEQISFVFDK
ncbi:hypothetical protein [Streptomyces sp. NPDC004728]|uniref:hypothetical protein n=1 Tax=Streptomyces sp. NPDC004728 TaxID=3154289 RepID=UPI0033B2D105